MKGLEISDVKRLYESFGDDISRNIFANRVMYSLTGDMHYIRCVVRSNTIGRNMCEKIKGLKGAKAIFGSGIIGKSLASVYRDYGITCFIDNNHQGKTCEGFSIISLEEYISQYPDGNIIISTKLYWKEIIHQLLSNGIKQDKIINLGKDYLELNHLQYFDLPELLDRKFEKEIFIDGGCYDGGTSMDYVKWISNNNIIKEGAEIVAWELDSKNLERCKKQLDLAGIGYKLINKGLWSHRDKLKFESAGRGSVLSDSGDSVVEVDNIDSLKDVTPTFIKMDVEGSEYQALVGAENTIGRVHPRLAICVYHKLEDIWEIPLLIQRIAPDYVFYLRHYSFADNETVLYAI